MSWTVVIIAIVAIVFLYVISKYNDLVKKNVAVNNAWSQIDVQLKRRHDLIPNLVEVVKQYAKHERETLTKVIEARNAAVTAAKGSSVEETAQAERALTSALRQIFALAENYPNLKANENFAKLQEELTSTENRIAFARQHYNDSVSIFNTAIQQFPTNIVANMFNFRRREFFEIDDARREELEEAPKLNF
ncbi:MAG: LemA family protein [Candidatus Dadabacteria bacterium]|nr:MAG: LemA family protein [Candidatus Dadabacteria bacterium]